MMQPHHVGDRRYGAPGHTQVLGGENPGQAFTLITFADRSMLRVHWDGHYEVSGMREGSGVLTVYCPYGRRLYFPWHRIDMIDHQEAQESP